MAAEVIQQVAKGIYDQENQSVPASEDAGKMKQPEQPVDSVLTLETSWTEPVAVAKTEPDHGPHSRRQLTGQSQTDDFWQGYGVGDRSMPTS